MSALSSNLDAMWRNTNYSALTPEESAKRLTSLMFYIRANQDSDLDPGRLLKPYGGQAGNEASHDRMGSCGQR